MVGDFNTLLTSMDGSSRQKIHKETAALKATLDQVDLIDICRAFHSKAAEDTFSSSAHGTFSRLTHIVGHKTSLNTFKKIELISHIFSGHNGVKPGISHKEINLKTHNDMETKEHVTKQ